MKVGLYILLRMIQQIEITYFKLNGKQHSGITVPCFRMWLLYDRASERNNFDTNLTRKDWAFIIYKGLKNIPHIFARHIEWLYSKNRLLTYNHHLCFRKNRTKIKFSSNNYHFYCLINLRIWATTRKNVPSDNILGIRKFYSVYCFLNLISFI